MARIRVEDNVNVEAQTEVAEKLSDYEWLAKEVERAYDEGVTMEDAERLAAKCLGAQLRIAEALAEADLDSRMKKNGMKAMKANVYLRIIQAADKKPTETTLDSMITLDKDVSIATDTYDKADVRKESFSIYFEIFRDAHIYFRGISRGKYE